MGILWEDRAWEDYLYWQKQDKKTLKRINMLIQDIKKSPPTGGLAFPLGSVVQ
ncbi:toxin YoeB [Selenomonas sp. KH1T6]|jgi:toxin YoeB|nr:toxin YoeB [Selenomonas ruminantium]